VSAQADVERHPPVPGPKVRAMWMVNRSAAVCRANSPSTS